MNHFFAIGLPPETRQAVAEAAQDWQRLLATDQQAAWYDPSDYHITLKFLGDLPDSATPELITAAIPLAAASPFTLTPVGAGMFPNPIRPNVLWIGVEISPLLTQLAARIDTAVSSLGYPTETRPYRPHITVARCRSRRGTGIWSVPNERPFPQFRVDHFALMQTLPPQQRRNGLKTRYNTVHLFPFGTMPLFTH